jgi:hypothetical protein
MMGQHVSAEQPPDASPDAKEAKDAMEHGALAKRKMKATEASDRAEHTALEAAARKPAADAAIRLKLPFTVHPYAITDASHRHIRALHIDVDSLRPLKRPPEPKVKRLAILPSRLWTAELYADLCPRRGTLRLWSASIWTSPLHVYRDVWPFATKIYAAARQDVRKAPSWSDHFDPQRVAEIEAYAAADRAGLFLAPNGLCVLTTDLEWPFDISFAT